MPAFDLVAPGIPTQDMPDGWNYVADARTVALRDALNAEQPYPPTIAPTFYQAVRTTGPGIGDAQYNVGWHQLPVPAGIKHISHFESPNVPVTNLPFRENLYNSTLVQKTVNHQIVYSAYRAPAINEGF